MSTDYARSSLYVGVHAPPLFNYSQTCLVFHSDCIACTYMYMYIYYNLCTFNGLQAQYYKG